MKPLLIIKNDSADFDPERVKQVDDYFHELAQTNLKDYDILIIWGGDAKVYYPCKPLSFYYQKLKAWLILKIRKKNTF